MAALASPSARSSRLQVFAEPVRAGEFGLLLAAGRVADPLFEGFEFFLDALPGVFAGAFEV